MPGCIPNWSHSNFHSLMQGIQSYLKYLNFLYQVREGHQVHALAHFKTLNSQHLVTHLYVYMHVCVVLSVLTYTYMYSVITY